VNAPSFLPLVLSALMILVAGYALWRLGVARAWGQSTDTETDVLHLAAGVAAAGLLSAWAHTLPRDVWTALFSLGTGWFAYRMRADWPDPAARRAAAAHTGVCAVFVYAFGAGVAPSTIHGSSAGQFTMAGMPEMIKDQTVALPALGLVLVAALAFTAVAAVARLSPEPLGPEPDVVAAPPLAASASSARQPTGTPAGRGTPATILSKIV
jgi:hypothetical protein